MHIDSYIEEYNPALQYLYSSFVKKYSSYQDFISSLKDYLSQINLLEEDKNTTLLYETNQFIKTKYKNTKPNKNYTCPACLFFNKISILENKFYLHCNACKAQLEQPLDQKNFFLRKTFSCHSKTGYKCPTCNRFIPENNKSDIYCPYLDCAFIGNKISLKKMSHPTTIKNCQETITPLSCSTSLNKEQNFILQIIESQSNKLSYTNSNFTVPHKLLVYQSFKNLLHKYPQPMTDYLTNNSRTGGFQHKIFQEYIRLLEDSLPFLVKKNKKYIRISSLLDKELCIFHSLSTFQSIITNKSISNNTQEFYIGGRKATCSKPYYIGKLIGVVNANNNESILHLVKEYSFNKILIDNVEENTPVIVTHLSIPPHYQMGGMVYVNRIRKLIVEGIKHAKQKSS